MEALTKIVDLFLEGWEYIKCWGVVMEWQSGCIMRFGRFHRYAGPGYWWKIPLFEKLECYDTAATTLRLPAQTIKGRTVRGFIKYYIKDIKPYVCDLYAEENYLRDTTMGCISESMKVTDSDDLPSQEAIIENVRKEVNQYGFKILRVVLVDDTEAGAYRVMIDRDIEELD
ncbi:MAG: SPFH domain-containing protein [Planctomycetota bacterium]|jgi:regulator of protease activity HflC (stomatin/prohibitin superfamily)